MVKIKWNHKKTIEEVGGYYQSVDSICGKYYIERFVSDDKLAINIKWSLISKGGYNLGLFKTIKEAKEAA